MKRDDLATLFEESFRHIEASRLGETILKLCEAIARGPRESWEEREHD